MQQNVALSKQKYHGIVPGCCGGFWWYVFPTRNDPPKRINIIFPPTQSRDNPHLRSCFHVFLSLTNVRHFSADNSRAGNGCANFVGTWVFWFFLEENFRSAKTDPVRFKWVFGEVFLKDRFAFKSLIKVLYLRGEKCLQNAHFYRQKKAHFKNPFKLDRVSFSTSEV